jgi:hypothetical protein
MKHIITLIAVCFLAFPAFAADYTVQSVTQIPSGYTPSTNGWYTQSSTPDRYRVESSASSVGNSPGAGEPGSREGWTGPNTGDSTNILNNAVSNKDLRDGNVDMYTIPLAIAGIIETLLAVAGTIAIVALIYHAVQMQINSGITGDSSGVDKAKKWMFGSLIWFVIAILAYFIVTRVVELLYSAT